MAKDKKPTLEEKRHSLAHIFAQAALDMFPDAKIAIGPAIDNGFYYDLDLPRTLIPEDLPILEEKMKKIIAEAQEFTSEMVPVDEAIEHYKKLDQPYKIELAADLKEAGEKEVGFTTNGPFKDLCRGGHIANTKQIDPRTFKLDRIAGAYWRGDESRPMLQRVYGLAFGDKKELNEYLALRKEQEKRDHRKIGQALELFDFHELVGPGLPLWLPKGAVLVEELEKLAKEAEFRYGYDRVRSPHLAKGRLYETSGHLPYYADSMYPPMPVDNEEYYVKPMNCPHHHLIYAATKKSYRDLPQRYAEYGTCYRFEDSGALFGLMRVRSLQMNDAHLYCTEEQFESEFMAVTEMYLEYFKLFNIEKYVMRLSLHDPKKLGKKYVNEPELWKKTEEMVRNAMKKAKVNFIEVEDEAAFYGPKIDIEVFSAIGREFTLATNQVDFSVPGKFDLTYTAEDGEEKTPLCIHRAPLGTHERFIGFLIEHFAGAFPTWLAPVQVQLIPVAEPHVEYAKELSEKLRNEFVRVEIAEPTDSLGKRIRSAELRKIPYMIVLGDKEVESKELSVRHYRSKDQSTKKEAKFIEDLLKEIKTRELT